MLEYLIVGILEIPITNLKMVCIMLGYGNPAIVMVSDATVISWESALQTAVRIFIGMAHVNGLKI
jgi:hypothetical protein